jgi:quinolinate synthase
LNRVDADGEYTCNLNATALEKEAPGKRFEPVRDDAVCRFMKVTTLAKVRDSLRDMQHRIEVDPEIADKARLAIERMVSIA